MAVLHQHNAVTMQTQALPRFDTPEPTPVGAAPVEPTPEQWLTALAQSFELQEIAFPVAQARMMLTNQDQPVMEQLDSLWVELGKKVFVHEAPSLASLHLLPPGSILQTGRGHLLVVENDSLTLPTDSLIRAIEWQTVPPPEVTSNTAYHWGQLFSDIRSAQWFMEPVIAHAPLFKELLAAALIINGLALIQPFFAMHVYDRIIPNNSTDTLWMMVLGIGIAYCADFLLKLARHHLLDISGQRIDVAVTQRILQKLFNVKPTIQVAGATEFYQQLKTFESLRELMTSGMAILAVDLPFLFLYITILALVHWALAIPVLLSVALCMGLTWSGYLQLKKLGETAHTQTTDHHALWLETINARDTLKSVNANHWASRRLLASTMNVRDTTHQLKTVHYRINLWTQLSQQLAWVSVLCIGVYLVGESSISVGALIASSMIMMRCAQPVSLWINTLTQLSTVYRGFSGLNTFMHQRDESNPTQQPLPVNHGLDITLSNIKVVYRNNEVPQLNIPSLRVVTGERIALIGHMGSGKSTLLKLLAGLIPVDQGQLLVNHRDIGQWQPHDYRNHVVYLGSDPVLFRGNLRSNLKLGRHWLSDEECLSALKSMGLSDWIAHLPNGLDHEVQEHGRNLSSGQRQALILARICLIQPRLLLLDEADSHLDSQTQELLLRLLKQLPANCGVIYATHKTSHLATATRIVLMHEGTILLDGHKDEVLEQLKRPIPTAPSDHSPVRNR